jgi:copper chaperone CopZ
MKRMILFLVALVITSTAALADDVQYDIRVDGITCPFCVATSERALMRIEGVHTVGSDLETGTIFVCADSQVEFTNAQLKHMTTRNCGTFPRIMTITQAPKNKVRLVADTATSRKWGWLVLFASSTTLVCCALPIFLVTLGLGAVSASLFANLPFLVTLAHYKGWMFTGSGAVLMLTGWLLFRSGRTCPADPEAHRWNVRFFWASTVIWALGFAAAYLVLPIYLWLESS